MKIKKLTAVFAVAAMAAGFSLASPMLSAQAAPTTNPVPDQIADITYPGSLPAGSTLGPVDIAGLIGSDTTAASSPVTWFNGIQYPFSDYNTPLTTVDGWHDGWNCASVDVYDPSTGAPNKNLGSAYCQNNQLYYVPNPVMGNKGDIIVWLHYELDLVPNAHANSTLASTMKFPAIQGIIKVTVTQPIDTSICAGGYSAKCINLDVQAFTDHNTTSVKTELLSQNVLVTDAKGNVISGFVTGNGNWGLAALNNSRSNDNLLPSATLDAAATWKIGANSSTVTVTPPQKNWSGIVYYDYVLASFTCDSTGTKQVPGGTTACTIPQLYRTGLITVTVHPTLPAIDDIYSDQGAKVTIPVLEQSIIGSKPFQDASCTFDGTKGKTTLANVGSIVNKGGSKDPVFTPVADFVGDVTLSCTVADKWDPISNAVSVVIHVGTPAPAPVAPATTPAPACDNANGKCVLSVTGGSLATPMSSGLAAVVLLVAAGAGILVVRRRTSLAG